MGKEDEVGKIDAEERTVEERERVEDGDGKETGRGMDGNEKGGGNGGKEVEIGGGWDDGVDNKERSGRDGEEDVQIVESGNVKVPVEEDVARETVPARAEESEKRVEGEDGKKRRREGDDNENNSQPPIQDMVASMPITDDYQNHYRKRPRQECYRCGGDGHIAVMCVSEPEAKNNLNLTVCRNCNGRGHMSRDCPNSIPPGVCFRCRREGHRGRDCPNIRQGQYAGGTQGGEGSLGAIHSLNALLGGVTGQQPQGGYYAQAAGGYDLGYGGYDRGMYAMGGRPRVPVGTGRCFRCNEPGHWTKDCPYRPQSSDPNGCYKCGQPGHRAKECNVCFKCHGYGHNAFECPQGQQAH